MFEFSSEILEPSDFLNESKYFSANEQKSLCSIDEESEEQIVEDESLKLEESEP